MESSTAAAYIRSSKDRHEVSMESQRRELTELAIKKGLVLCKFYEDVVESAKDENRPGFQALLRDLKSPSRAWNTLLMVDTSRLSRRRYMAQVFKHEARKRGVTIIYSKLPESDPIADMVIIGVMEVFDELHSLMSREKGLAGMAENVRQGYRAGGRAPKGYRLRPVETGAMREGRPVTKSMLEPDTDAPLVQRYLQARARGEPRRRLKEKLGIPWPETSLVGLEWNALTYAGCTVWNQHQERLAEGGYKGGHKHRPRAEWVVQPGTHEALITQTEAGAILSQLEASHRAGARRTKARYLLTGLLKTPAGESWWGDGQHYRTKPAQGKSRWVPAEEVEQAVISQVSADLRSPVFVRALLKEARKGKTAATETDPTKELRAQISALTGKITRAMTLAVDLADPAPAMRLVDDLERQRRQLGEELSRQEREQTAARALADVTEADIQRLLDDFATNLNSSDREAVKDMLRTLVERIDLDPVTLECRVHYRVGVENRNSMASPRGFDVIPVLRLVRKLKIA